MLHPLGSDVSVQPLPHAQWRKFSAHEPAANVTVEIRRHHDDKTILRRRADLPATFDWRHAEWRPL